MEAGRRGGALEIGRLIYQGAEAHVYEGEMFGVPVVVKVRVEKPYRHKVLDVRLRTRRTVTEAKAVAAALQAGVPVPAVLYVDPVDKVLVQERIPGKPLSVIIEEAPDKAEELVKRLGQAIARLHEAGIAHGDLTTSNVVVAGTEVFLVDFGLAQLSASEKDKAVDLHLFLRSLESTHPEHVERMMDAFLRGYAEVAGVGAAKRLEELVREIRLMGRYREERRTVWGRGGGEEDSLRNR